LTMQNSVLAVITATAVLEGFLYGILLVSFFASLHLRISRRRKPGHPSSHKRIWCDFVVISSTTIFAMCTAHWILTVVRYSHGLLSTPDIPSALHYFMDPSKIPQVIRIVLGELTLLVGDVVIVFRLWWIWNRDWRVALLPAFSWLALVGTWINGYTFKFATPIRRFQRSSHSIANVLLFNLHTNLYCTALIAWKVWRTTQAVRGIGDGPFIPVLAILVESAAIWTAWLLFFVITYHTGSVLSLLAIDLTPPVLGIASIFIYLRVELGSSSQTPTHAQAMTLTSPASIVLWGSTSVRPADTDLDGLGPPTTTMSRKSQSV
ncbi:hypothetical protein K438DRAFT_1578419, partial [Mycena galopus ATCC 62051]